jgi:integrase
VKLTANTIRTLTLPKGEIDRIFFDTDVPGFGLRLRFGGAKTWLVQYAVAGKTRRMSLGPVAALDAGKARETAKDILAKVRLGGDPAGEKGQGKAKAGETVGACIKLYLNRRRNDGKLRASTLGEIERHLTRNIKPLHSISIHQLDRRAIALEIGRLAERAPTQANRTLASLRKFLNWCAGEGLIDANPAAFVNKSPEVERDRVLTIDEVAMIWRALSDGDFADIVKLLALTGQRRNEISDLRWGEVDLDRAVAVLPAARTKNHRRHEIPLAPAALAILTACKRSGRDLVFGNGASQHGFSGWSAAKRQLDARLSIKPWVLHDLRRAVATGMGEIGILPHIIEAVLNHASGAKRGVAGIYNHARHEAKKTSALLRWAEVLMAAVEGRDVNVTPPQPADLRAEGDEQAAPST